MAREYHGFEEEQLIDVTRLGVESGFAEDAVKEGLRAKLGFPRRPQDRLGCRRLRTPLLLEEVEVPKRSLAAILLAAFVLILGLVAAGCGEDEEEPTSGGSGTSQEEEKPAIKVGLVTDIGGLNDRSFNQLANEGLERAKSELGVEGRALTSESDADYVPNLSTLAQQQYDLVIGVGFLMADSINTVAKQFPDTNFAIIDFPQAGLEGQARQRARPALQGERGRLPRRLPRRAGRQGEGRRPGDLLGRRPEDPAGRRLHRRLPGRREGGRARASRRSTATRRTSSTRRSARRSRSTRSRRARRSSSRSPASAASARSTRPRRRACSASASTPTRATSAITS